MIVDFQNLKTKRNCKEKGKHLFIIYHCHLLIYYFLYQLETYKQVSSLQK